MKRLLRLIILLIIIPGLLVAWIFLLPNNSNTTKYLLIPTHAGYAQVKDSVQGKLTSAWTFNLASKLLGYSGMVKPGRYAIKPGMNNLQLIRSLRSGRQAAVKLVINKMRTKTEVSLFLGSKFEAGAASWDSLLSSSSFLNNFGADTNTALTLFIPNTYEIYWNTAPDKVLKRLYSEQQKFWTDARVGKASQQKLTPAQAYTLASIVEEESNYKKERPNIASVYLNRLHTGMRLQADPTVKFAVGNFELRRILQGHTQTVSPYNTYLVTGLPPGPICIPSTNSIDAVLDAPSTTYLYFCANADFSGSHVFATTYADHLVNARAFQKALNDRNIK
jgi:UPF0755 protein